MISFFKYFEARRRLKGMRKTIKIMGGPSEVSSLMLAQEEMTQDEVTYFWYKFLAETIYTLMGTIIVIVAYGVYEVI
jgi:hypothetical protein